MVVSVVVLATAGVGWIWLKLSGDINTFSSDGISGERPDASSGGQNVLVIGSDSRAGANKGLGGGEGEVGRSDTAFLLHTYADGEHAVAVSVPRDTLVDIPRCKLPDGSWSEPRSNTMFNSAFSTGNTAEGNPACTQNTIEKLTGLRVDHTVVVDFDGFSKLTSVVGGVEVCLPHAIYQNDLNPNRTTRGKRVFAGGPQKVSGQQALDYVRIRHGIGDGSDIGRIKRQQAFVSSLIKKIRSDGLTPTHLLPLAEAATSSMTVDPGLGTANKMLSFAMSLKNVDLHNTKFVTVPWRYEGARVAVVEPDADALWATLKADRPLDEKKEGKQSGSEDADAEDGSADPSPSAAPTSGEGITVTVHNGTTSTGLAAQAAKTLRAGGFTVAGTATAPDQDHPTSVIEYGPGQKNEAQTTARWFPGAELVQDTEPGISVTLGRTYAEDPAAAPSSPAPAASPSAVGADARSADEDPCKDLSYG
ncbi:transcriptional regulator [Streptomyces tsukubensis]|uniref:Transcriptional regulator n=1 Tax=Streptomyces tsukubensis TaxID=83656 RepID=A0A1V4A6T5_9ACTN|nr:transcriptional regulator [Streptomyces tsukubensis]